MPKYRVVVDGNGVHHVQRRTLFFFWENLSYAEVNKEDACRTMKWYMDNDLKIKQAKVIKVVNCDCSR